MTSDRRERVAKLLYDRDNSVIKSTVTWESADEEDPKDWYRHTADAVLHALKDELIPELPEIDEGLVNVLVDIAPDIVPTKGAARRYIAQGAIRIEGDNLWIGQRLYSLKSSDA